MFSIQIPTVFSLSWEFERGKSSGFYRSENLMFNAINKASTRAANYRAFMQEILPFCWSPSSSAVEESLRFYHPSPLFPCVTLYSIHILTDLLFLAHLFFRNLRFVYKLIHSLFDNITKISSPEALF